MDKETILQLLSAVTDATVNELKALDDTALLEDHGLTSIGFIRFIVSVEETFSVEILDSDLILSNFATLQGLFATLEKYFAPQEVLKKVLVTDCDNVLWRGIAGEESLVIDDDARALQETFLRLQQRGILLCLCSKNEPANIAEAFASPSMCLQTAHILLAKINRQDKASNLRELAAELNVDTSSFVFVDDSEYEIGLVNALLPEVTTEKAVGDIAAVCARIEAYFDGTPVSDVDRTRQYREQKQREQDKHRFVTVEEYNASLETIVTCVPAAHDDAARIAELTQRTNQCNLSGKRYTVQEIEHVMNDKHAAIITLKASDKYGDMGLVGAAVITGGNAPVIEGFFVSCRVFDRGFETRLLDTVKRLFPVDTLRGVYVPTEKNTRYRDFYRTHGVNEA